MGEEVGKKSRWRLGLRRFDLKSVALGDCGYDVYDVDGV